MISNTPSHSTYAVIDSEFQKHNKVLKSLIYNETELQQDYVDQTISNVCKSSLGKLGSRSVREFKESGLPSSFFEFRQNLKELIKEHHIDTAQNEWYQKFNKKYVHELKKLKYFDNVTERVLKKDIKDITEGDITHLSKYIKTLNAEYLTLQKSIEDYTVTLLLIDLLLEFTSKYGQFSSRIEMNIKLLPSSLQKLLMRMSEEGFKTLGTSCFDKLRKSFEEVFNSKNPTPPYAKKKIIELLLWAQFKLIEGKRPEFDVPYLEDILVRPDERGINTRYYHLYQSTTLDELDDEAEYYSLTEIRPLDELHEYKKITVESITHLEKRAELYNKQLERSVQKYQDAFNIIKKYLKTDSKLQLHKKIHAATKEHLEKVFIKAPSEIKKIDLSPAIIKRILTESKNTQYKNLISYIEIQPEEAPREQNQTLTSSSEIHKVETDIDAEGLIEQFNKVCVSSSPMKARKNDKPKPQKTQKLSKLTFPKYLIPSSTSISHDRVERWFDKSRDPIAEDEKYNNPTDEKFKKRIRAFHSFARIADGFIEKYGTKKTLSSEKYEDSTEYILPCLFTLEEEAASTEFYGEISSCINDTTNVNWHRYFKPLKKDGLYFNGNIYVAEFPKLGEIKNKTPQVTTRSSPACDGSFVKEVTTDYVIIHDPKNRAILKLLINSVSGTLDR